MNELMDIVRELVYLEPPVGMYFIDTQLNTLSKDSFLYLSMFEAMAINESNTKHDGLPHISMAMHLKMQESLRKKKKNKGDADDE